MEIVIIGGGASGLLSAVLINQKYPSYHVTIMDKNNKLAKKVYATGNGKCNFANTGELMGKYNNHQFINKLYEEVSPKDLIALFESFGIHSFNNDDLVYPISESSETLIGALLGKLTNTKFILNTKVLDYNFDGKQYIVHTENSDFKADKVIIATGLASSPKLGGDASFLDVLKYHGYKLMPLYPGLCPLKLKEDVKSLEGIRRKVRLSLFMNNSEMYLERGEILFKKDGLSGICVFNAASTYSRYDKPKGSKLVIDFLPDVKDVKSYEGYFVKPLEEYLKKYASNVHKVEFNILDTYDFDNSQVSIGGVDVSNINDSFMSKIEKDVYILGETLDIDGLCGGYNLMFAFISSMKMVKDL